MNEIKPIWDRIWSYKFCHKQESSHEQARAWDREVEEFVHSLTLEQKSIFRELQHPACEFLNILEDIIRDVEGLKTISSIPEIDILPKEEYQLCIMLKDISQTIILENDGFLIDPEWRDPIPRGSCYLEDMI